MNKPESKVPFVITEEPSINSVFLEVDTLPHLVRAVKSADLDDVFLNLREGYSITSMSLLVNPCYDATEVRAYLEHLLTEAHEAWLAAGGWEAEFKAALSYEDSAAPETSDGDAEAGGEEQEAGE